MINRVFTAIVLLCCAIGYVAAQELPADPSRENDLLSRLQNAHVKPMAGEDFACCLNVAGAVISSTGQPVEGAIVCLVEWRSIPSLPAGRPERKEGILARTRTDAGGHYVFRDVKTNNVNNNQSGAWLGYVVAAHPTAGIGWSVLPRKDERSRNESDVSVSLQEFADISGVYHSPDGQPIADAQLCLYAIDETVPKTGVSPWMPYQGLHLGDSQLMPTCTTNNKGEFRFRNLPRGFAAIVLAPQDSNFISSFAAISTDPTMQKGSRGDNVSFGHPKELLGTNRVFVARAGRRLRGQLKDEAGLPVSGVQVIPSPKYASTTTNDDGRFELVLPPDLSSFKAAGDLSVYQLDFIPDGKTSLLPRTELIVVNSKHQMLFDKPDVFVDSVSITLAKGIRVRGKVEDTDGQPLQNVVVEQIPQARTSPNSFARRPRPSAITKEDGSFELFLPPEGRMLHFSCRSPGLALPASNQLVNDPQQLQKLPHIEVDLKNGDPITLEPVRVARVPPVDVTVLLPSQQPAAGAEVVLWEHKEQQNPLIEIDFPTDPNHKEISAHVMTDEKGKAQLHSVGKPSVRATVKAKLLHEGVVLEGEATLVNGPGKSTVVLLLPPLLPPN